MVLTRRSLLTGFGAALAAPAIVRASSLMPVRGIIMPVEPEVFLRVLHPSMFRDLQEAQQVYNRARSELLRITGIKFSVAYLEPAGPVRA